MEFSVKKPEEADEVEVVEELETEELETQEEASDGEDGEEEQETGEQIEIVLEGDDGSQPKDHENLGIRKRINKLNAKVSEAQDGASQAVTDLAAEREKNKLLQLALQQQKEEPAAPVGPPDPLDFDDGAGDAKYKAALIDFIQGVVKANSPAPQPVVDQNDTDLEAAQTRHYKAADKLNISGYAEAETVAVGILGNKMTNDIIKQTSNSEVILYHLGKNPEKAERLAELFKTNLVRAIMEIGALETNLKVKTGAKRNQAPNPDDELEGATSPRNRKRGPKGAKFE